MAFASFALGLEGHGLSHTYNPSLLCFEQEILFKCDVVQFCNGNCSVAKVVVPLRKGKQEHVKALIIYRKI